MMMPALFVGHGSPMNAIENNAFSQKWRLLAKQFPKPKAILAISAHWLTEGSAMTFSMKPETLHDFYGFPPALYDISYPANGDHHLVKRVQHLAQPHTVFADTHSGLDHGTWSILHNMYPDASVPTVQLSIDITQSEQFHFDLGQKLAELRQEGVLILGSGNIVHNLRLMNWEDADPAPYPWAVDFDDYVKNNIEQNHPESLIDYKILMASKLAVPTPEHYLPLLYILGARQPQDKVHFPVTGFEKSSISMRAVIFQSNQ